MDLPSQQVACCPAPSALNFDSTCDGGCCATPAKCSCCVFAVRGCTDSAAANFFAYADEDDGSCIFHRPGCTLEAATNFDSSANVLDEAACIFPWDDWGSYDTIQTVGLPPLMPPRTPPARSPRLGRPALPPLPPAAPPAPTEPSAEARPAAPPPASTPSFIGDPNLAQGDVSLAFFIVPVATVGSVALAVALFYAWRCWRDRKRRPVRPSALNIVGIEA